MAKARRKIDHLGKFKTSGIKVSELIEAKWKPLCLNLSMSEMVKSN